MPKAGYFALQCSFLTALIALNWDYLTTQREGILVFALTVLLVILTVVFYLMTGCVDPGFVHN